MGVFDIFNSTALTITKIDVTPSYTNQTTGAFVPESTTTTTISGHVTDISIQELALYGDGVVSKGDRKLTVESTVGLAPGDRITIVEIAGDTSYWTVASKLNSSVLMDRYLSIKRETFLLKRIT